MEQQNYQYQNDSVFVQGRSESKRFFGNVFLWMFVAVIVSAVAAYFIASTPEVLSYFLTYNAQTGKGGISILGFAAIFAPVGLVFLMGARMHTMSYGALIGFFLLYSLLTGVMLSFILLAYATVSIVICFGAAAAIFLVMAVMGYTTNTDLSKFGPILFAGVIGLVIISLINMFLGSDTLDYILGLAGVAIFTALTAYKVQELKRIGEGLDEYGNPAAIADSKKLAIIGALSLYITFINLFMSLLRIFGNRR